MTDWTHIKYVLRDIADDIEYLPKEFEPIKDDDPNRLIVINKLTKLIGELTEK